MNEEEEKQEESPVDHHEETEYEDSFEVSNGEHEDVSEDRAEGATSAPDDDEHVDSNADSEQKNALLPADAPWKSRMWEGTRDVVTAAAGIARSLFSLSSSIHNLLASRFHRVWRTRGSRGHPER
jgi:hypothetical protein